ncbi:MAG TPA: hypothetical protein VFN42_06075 [Acetobacteraceae bacterium]|nr:hypothetical protein [Acetobacteraceae bacterium]
MRIATEALVDNAVERSGDGPYNSGLEARVSRLETDMSEVKAVLVRLESAVTDLRVIVARIDAQINAQLPYLATKADLAEKPSKTYMWGILGALLTAYACGLAALAILK